MKRLLTAIFSLFLFTFSAHAQNDVFVLVDVSTSVTQSQLTDAKQALKEVFTGSPLSRAFIAQGSDQDLGKFKLVQGNKLAIAKFGSLQTTLAIDPRPTSIQNITADISQVLNSINWMPIDNQTYITLAKAKIAEYAKNHHIAKYKLYIISDNVQDDYGQNGMPNYPDQHTRNLVEGYNTTNNPVNEQPSTKLKLSNSSSFALTFIPSIDVSNYNPSGNSTTTTTTSIDTTAGNAVITLTSFANGTRDNPKPTNSNSFTISWTSNIPSGTKYDVLLTEIGGGRYRVQKRNLTTNSVMFSAVPPGEFRIDVSAQNSKSARSHIKTPSSGSGWIIPFLVLLFGGVGGYYYWNKKREAKLEIDATNQGNDMFSSGNNSGSTSNTSSKSEYF